ncbi:MAG: helix-turn-helix domain-containing protein [Butyrivibrio crossotus]|nr:helix-turn-helix domain-containing protein [Butyrivibrio crossotus]
MKHRPEYDLKVIGENLKRLREEKSLSVKDVQEYLRLGSVQAIYKYESGKGYPQADTMFALMELYEADINDIIHKHESVINRCNDEIGVYCTEKYLFPESNIVIDIMNIDKSEKQKRRIHQYYEYIKRSLAG